MRRDYYAAAIDALVPNNDCTIDGSKVTWIVTPENVPTDGQIAAKIEELKNAEPYRLLREERTRILSESDWMANSDVTMSDEWKNYRQELRDLPKTHPVNYGDPKLDSNGNLDMSSITWPTSPS